MNFEGCQQCHLRPGLCHGVDGYWGMNGCPAFDHSKCEEYEWTCVCNSRRLAERVLEVGGFKCKLNTALRPIDIILPKYIPTFYHGFPETRPLELEWIALPLHSLFKSATEDRIKWIADGGKELRESLRVRQDTKIILTGPGPDQLIEDFWRFHRHAKLLQLLKALDIQLFTVPNFSFFSDAPPLHHNYNLSRILRVTERASEAGVPAVLHLNAIHEHTWQVWESIIRNHPEIKHVCMEFQTGYATQNTGLAALNRFVELQLNVKRPLHPILIGAARYAGFLKEHFDSSTIVDAQPFLHTFNRKIFRELPDGKARWKFSSTKPFESLIPRFKMNLCEYSRRINKKFTDFPARQTEFGFQPDSSGPLVSRHKQKSVASLPLFCKGRKPHEQTSVPIAVSNSARSTGGAAATQTAIVRTQGLSKPKLATSRPNSHRKSNRHTRQPNGFDGANKTGVAGGH